MNSGLRGGLSTGCCAAAAAKAATMLLCGHAVPEFVELVLPDGDMVKLVVENIRLSGDACTASVRKDAGDDPDVTDGSMVSVSVTRINGNGISFFAGDGVGTVTLPGLAIPPGEPAINPVPRQMIEQAVRQVTDEGLSITVSIPGGHELAAKTFNPRLGIVGGLSVLGTTGRVRPFSHLAVQETIRCSFAITLACGIRKPVLVPGHIGARAARRHLHILDHQLVEVGNEWGYILDQTLTANLDSLLLLGHPGKLAKLQMGQWDTHSSRSVSPLPCITTLCESLFGSAPSGSPTVEGLFCSLSASDRTRLATVVAEGIADKVQLSFALPCQLAVALIDNNGDWMGSCGDLSSWQTV